MTDQQFNYLYQETRQLFRSKQLRPPSKTEFRAYMGLLFSGVIPDVPVEVARDAIFTRTNEVFDEMQNKTMLDRELLKQFVSLEE